MLRSAFLTCSAHSLVCIQVSDLSLAQLVKPSSVYASTRQCRAYGEHAHRGMCGATRCHPIDDRVPLHVSRSHVYVASSIKLDSDTVSVHELHDSRDIFYSGICAKSAENFLSGAPHQKFRAYGALRRRALCASLGVGAA